MSSSAVLTPRASRADAFGARFSFQLVSISIVFYATGPVLARSSDTTGALLSFWRLWFGVIAFVLALLAHRASGRPLGSARGVKLAVLAGAVFAVNQIAFLTAVKRTSVVDVALLGTLSPIMVALLAAPLFGERPGARFRWWSLVGIAGAVYVVAGSSAGPNGDLLGMLLGVLATAAFAGFFVISKLSRGDMPVVSFLAVVMATAAVCVSGYVAVLGYAPSSVQTPDLWRALGMALIPGALGHIAMTWPLQHVPANVPPLFRLTTPVVAGVFAWIVLGEGFTLVHVTGGVIIIVGLAGAISSQAGRDLVAGARKAAA